MYVLAIDSVVERSKKHSNLILINKINRVEATLLYYRAININPTDRVGARPQNGSGC